MGDPRTWQPSIDPDLCTACRTCLEFCPRQVYSQDAAGRVRVSNGGNCVDGCHGCEWQCPQWAITFPEPLTAAYLQKAATYCAKRGKELPRPMVDYARARYGVECPPSEGGRSDACG